MEPNETTLPDSPNARRPRTRLADAAAEDQMLAQKVVEEENATAALVAATKDERLGALIIAAANRIGRIRDLSTVLMAVARRDSDAIAMAALSDSLSPRMDNVK